MRVCTDYHISGKHYPLLRKQYVLYTHFTDVIAFYTLFDAKIPHELNLLSRENIFIRHKMVGYHYNLRRIENFINTDLPEFLDGYRCCNIISQDDIDPGINKFAGADTFFPRMGSQHIFNSFHFSFL